MNVDILFLTDSIVINYLESLFTLSNYYICI